MFFNRAGDVMAARVTRPGDGIDMRLPVRIRLSDAPVLPLGSDGKRILVMRFDPDATQVPIQVVRNGSALLAP